MTDPTEAAKAAQAQQKEQQIKQEIQKKFGGDLLNEFKAKEMAAQAVRDEIDNNIEEVKKDQELPKSIKTEPLKLQQVKDVTKVVEQTIIAIKTNRIILQPGNSSMVLIEALNRPAIIASITDSTAPYIYEIIRRGINGELGTTDQLISTLLIVENVKYINYSLYKNLVDDFYKQAEKIGWSETEKAMLERIKKDLLSSSNQVESTTQALPANIKTLLQESRRRAREQADFFTTLRKNLIGNDKARGRVYDLVCAELTARNEDPSNPNKLDPNQLKDEIERLTGEKINQISQDLDEYGNLYDENEYDKQGRLQAVRFDPIKVNAYFNKLSSLVNQGVLMPDEAEQIKEFVLTNQHSAEKGAANFNYERNLKTIAASYGIELDEYADILDAIDDNTSVKFAALLQQDKYKNKSTGVIDLDLFWNDIRDVCEEVISVVDTEPGAFFGDIFSPMYHGNFYRVLKHHLKNAGERLAKNNPEFAKNIVEVESLVPVGDPNQDELGIGSMDTSKTQLDYYSKKRTTLASGISEAIVGNVSMYKDAYEYLHDGERIVNDGLGWETMKKYAAKARSSVLTWLFHQDKDISLAHSYYIPALKRTLILNNRIATPSLNNPSEVNGLELSQERAFHNLLGHKIGDGEYVFGDQKKRAKLKRRVRLAAAYAKVGSFEYWPIWQQVHMPHKRVEVADPEFKKQGGKRVEFGLDPAGVDHGIDIMKSAMDWWATCRRFNLPNLIPALPYLFQKIKLHGYDPFDHTDVYKVKKMYEDSYFRGASNEFLKFIKTHVLLGDFLRFGIVGTFLRKGWRLEDFRKYIFMKDKPRSADVPDLIKQLEVSRLDDVRQFIRDLNDDEIKKDNGIVWRHIMGSDSVCPDNLTDKHRKDFKKNLLQYLEGQKKREYDFPKTMFELMSVGTQAVKMFIENVDIARVDQTTYDAIVPVVHRGKKKNEKVFKKACMQEFVFDKMFNLAPTKVVNFERRLYTPFGEKTVLEDVWGHLETKYGQKLDKDIIHIRLTPLFLEALEVAQTIKRLEIFNHPERYGDLASLRKIYALSDPTNPLSGGLTLDDLNNPQIKKALLGFFNEFKNDFPKIASYQKGEQSIDFLQPDNFINEALPEFLTVLKKSIYKPRKECALEQDEFGVFYETEEYKAAGNITLRERFYDWINPENERRWMDAEWGAEDTDFVKFSSVRGGERLAARFVGEGDAIFTKAVGAQPKIWEGFCMETVKKSWKSAHELEEFSKKNLSPIIKGEMKDIIAGADQELAKEVSERMIIYVNRAIGVDDPYRMAIVGDVRADIERRLWGTQACLYQDALKNVLHRPTYPLNVDQQHALAHAVGNDCNLPIDKENTAKVGYRKEVKFKLGPLQYTARIPDYKEYWERGEKTFSFGPFKKIVNWWPVKKTNDAAKEKWNQEGIEDYQGFHGSRKFIERVLPYALWIFALIMFMYAAAADKKNKGK